MGSDDSPDRYFVATPCVRVMIRTTEQQKTRNNEINTVTLISSLPLQNVFKQSFSNRIICIFCLFPKNRVVPDIISQAGVYTHILSSQILQCFIPYRFLFRSFLSPASIHTGRQVTSGGESVLLGLTGPPREGCGLGVRLANGSGAQAALWKR